MLTHKTGENYSKPTSRAVSPRASKVFVGTITTNCRASLRFVAQALKKAVTVMLVLVSSISSVASEVSQSTWQGLRVEPEYRCSPYNSKDYSYPQSVEPQIIHSIGKIYSPYTGRCFENRRQTDIEHIVARSEAHDSGLCAASKRVRRQFATDLLNLTLASPRVNRTQKIAYDAADWVPQMNQCWFAKRIVDVKKKYALSIDQREAAALERILSQCTSTKMIVVACQNTVRSIPVLTTQSPTSFDPLSKWDDNGNGRITCKEARRHGIAPVFRNHPAYSFMRDGDGDGVVCE